MTDVATRRAKEIAQTEAGKAAAAILHLEQAATIATRIKDASALERALIAKLESQREFAAEYKTKFPHGGDHAEQDDSTVVLGADWCLSYGFHVRTVQRWLNLLQPETYVDKKNAILKRCWELAELWQAANYSSESVDWYTPAKYIEAAREALGGIDLDPASSTQANAIVRASEIFTIEDDGLARDWFGRIFVNPPYGKTPEHRSLAAAFCNKAITEYENGNIDACIVLVNSLHSQSWQAPLFDHTICFVDHRIHFVSADGEENENPTFQNIFIYLGRDIAKFAKVFSRIGYVMQRVVA